MRSCNVSSRLSFRAAPRPVGDKRITAAPPEKGDATAKSVFVERLSARGQAHAPANPRGLKPAARHTKSDSALEECRQQHQQDYDNGRVGQGRTEDCCEECREFHPCLSLLGPPRRSRRTTYSRSQDTGLSTRADCRVTAARRPGPCAIRKPRCAPRRARSRCGACSR